jgi:Ca-activated chloride channel homolog
MHKSLRAFLCVLSIVSLYLPALRIDAQSGRHKTQSPATTRPSTQTTRPRSVNTNSTPREQASPTPRASSGASVPSNPAALGEPPPFPTPTAAPPRAAAASKPDDEIDVSDVVRINSNLVTVPASVLDAQGKAVINLKLEDFELRVDGQPKPITELGFADSPVRMAVLFDNSSSLVAAREFEKQAAIRFFRSVLRPVDQAMIYSVSTVPTLEYPLTSDVQTLVRTIDHFPKPEGATALFDAIVQAAAYLKPHQEGRRVIVIVSDGADTISDVDFETTLRRAQAADCQIYAVQTGQIENANLHDLAAERRLQEFTSQTGGAVYVPRGSHDLDAAFAQIAADLAQQYVLSYYPEEEQRDGRFRTISVRVTTRPNLRVRARKGYYALPGQRQAWLPNVTTTPGMQTQLVARNDTASSRTSNQDQLSNGSNASQEADNSSSRTSNAASVSASPVYLKTNNDAGVVRDRVGPRGPTDDPGSMREREREAKNPEPDNSPNASSNTTPKASSSGPSSTATSPAPSSRPSATPTPTPSPTPAASSSPTVSQPNASTSPQNKSEPTKESGPPAESKSKDSQPSTASQPAENKSAPKAPVSGGVLNGKAVSLPKPVYPLAAKNMGVAGIVTIEVTLDETGKVISARALSGHPLLLSSCVNAARLARFSPTILSGQAVKVSGTITYTFMR